MAMAAAAVIMSSGMSGFLYGSANAAKPVCTFSVVSDLALRLTFPDARLAARAASTAAHEVSKSVAMTERAAGVVNIEERTLDA